MTLSLSISRTVLVTALLMGALGCSDDSAESAALGIGVAGRGGGAGTGGVAGSSGGSGTGGALGGATSSGEDEDGAAGSLGAAGSAGEAGAAGAAGAAADAGAAGSAGFGGSGPADAGGDPSPPAADKLVALTFDDGPNVTLTPLVLEKLEAHGVPASFFLIGANITAATQPVLERAATLGCTFENHSNGFASLTGMSVQAIQNSVDTTSALIVQFTGSPPAFFRAPNLATDATVFGAIDLPFAAGIVVGDFPGGNAGGNPTVQSVVNAVRSQVQDGSIILMHDVQPGLNPQVTPDALDIIIPELEGQGYEFVNLRQLFQRRGVDPNTLQNGQWQVVPPTP